MWATFDDSVRTALIQSMLVVKKTAQTELADAAKDAFEKGRKEGFADGVETAVTKLASPENEHVVGIVQRIVRMVGVKSFRNDIWNLRPCVCLCRPGVNCRKTPR